MQARQQPFAGNAGGGAYGQGGGGADAANVLGDVGDMLDLAANHLEVALAGLGQGDIAANPDGQRRAQVHLERLYLLADRRWRDPKLLRGSRNASGARHRVKDDDRAKWDLHPEPLRSAKRRSNIIQLSHRASLLGYWSRQVIKNSDARWESLRSERQLGTLNVGHHAGPPRRKGAPATSVRLQFL